jgi:DNA repair ATPase RecN
MSELTDKVQEAVESTHNGRVALFVAIIATLMALCNVKDGNIVQAMQQAQARSVDLWSYYQSKGTKENIAQAAAASLRAQLDLFPDLSAPQRAKVEARIGEQEALATKFAAEKEAIKKEAEEASQSYDALNVHDDQFDLAEACLSVAIALGGVTALTQKQWLFVVAGVFAAIGVIYGLAGFLGWHLHSDLMARLLG